MKSLTQGYPLLAETEDGDEHLVVGWTQTEDEGVAPCVVPLVGAGRPRVLVGEVAYRLPAEAPARAH